MFLMLSFFFCYNLFDLEWRDLTHRIMWFVDHVIMCICSSVTLVSIKLDRVVIYGGVDQPVG